ncbi:MAG: TonB-dependent receptor, partial [Pseudomonadota bacterium]
MNDRLAAPLPRLVFVCALSALAFTEARAEDPEQRVLPTVIVTGQKMAQTLEQVPASVTSIDGDFMREIGVMDVDTMQNYAANVTILMTSSAAQVSVRGLGTPNSNQASDPSVGTVIDGVFYGRSSFATAFVSDVDRFEVLRGPQGTLFGKNSTAGLLNIVTRAPEEDDVNARVEVLTAGYGARTYRPMVNLPLMEGVAVRFSGNYSMSDGVLYNTKLKRDERNPRQYTSRLRISVEPAEGWRGDIEGFTSNQFENFNIFKILSASTSMTDLIKARDANYDEDPTSHRNSSNVPSKESSIISGANFTLTHDMGGTFDIRNLEFTSISAYGEQFTKARDLDADFTPVAFIRDSLIQPSPYRQFSQELRFSGNNPTLMGWGHGFSFVTGLYYFDSNFKTSDKFEIQDLSEAAAYVEAANAASAPQQINNTFYQLSPVLGTALNAINALGVNVEQAARVNLDQHDKAYAIFGQFEHMFLPEWAIIGGARYGYEKKTGLASSQSNGLPVLGQLPQPVQDAILGAIGPITSQITGQPASCGISIISLIAHQCNHVTPVSIEEKDFSPKL